MKIIVTADTHMPDKAKHLPKQLISACQTADMIIHAGDWKTMDAYNELSRYAPVKGVFGNVDDAEVQAYFPEKQLININNYKIGLVHGHGEKKTTEKRVLEAFAEEQVDIIIFGHSHIPMIRYFKKTMLMNPGSPTDKRALPYYSYGILDIGETISAEIRFFGDKS